jgi:hypothetical protein
VLAQLLGVALDLAAAHGNELVGSVVVQLLLAVVRMHLRDAVAAGVIAPDTVCEEADAVVFPVLYRPAPLAHEVGETQEVEVGVAPVAMRPVLCFGSEDGVRIQAFFVGVSKAEAILLRQGHIS